MENPAELKYFEDQHLLVQEATCDADSKKHKTLSEGEDISAKRLRLEDKDETLECLKSLCDSVLENNAECPSESRSVEQSEIKSEAKQTKKKKKKLKDPNNKVKKTQSKSNPHMRKNIRDILKDNELEAETRAAQQREIERVQRLQQLQQRPIVETNFTSDSDDKEDNPAATLVEDLQALAKELEDSSLSPEIPTDFITENEQAKDCNLSIPIKVFLFGKEFNLIYLLSYCYHF